MRVVSSDPKIMHGAPCFTGTRVTLRSFFDHLEAGYSVEEFLEQFPTVRREQITALLDELHDAAHQIAIPA